MRVGVRPRRVRADVAALENVRLRRAQARMPRGARYVLNDEEYEVWCVSPTRLTLRSLKRPNAFLIREGDLLDVPFDAERWR